MSQKANENYDELANTHIDCSLRHAYDLIMPLPLDPEHEPAPELPIIGDGSVREKTVLLQSLKMLLDRCDKLGLIPPRAVPSPYYALTSFAGNKSSPDNSSAYFKDLRERVHSYHLARNKARLAIRDAGIWPLWGAFAWKCVRGFWCIRCLYLAGRLRQIAGIIEMVDVVRHAQTLEQLFAQ